MNNLNLSTEAASGYTAVSDLFIDEYVPSANGDFVKVYLYLLRLLSRKNSNLSISSLADTFNQTENDVMRALRYWDKLGLLALSYDNNNELSGITFRQPGGSTPVSSASDASDASHTTFNSFSEAAPVSAPVQKTVKEPMTEPVTEPEKLPLKEAVEPSKVTVSPDKLNELSSSDDFSMLIFVVQTYLGKTLSSGEINAIVYFYDTLHFPADLIEYLIEYCVSKGKTSLRYIEKVALSWADEGICTVAAAKEEISNHNEVAYRIMRAFGITGREPGQAEKQLISKWTDVFCFDSDMIIEACNRTLKATHQPSFEYADSILTKWNSSNIRNSEDVKKSDAQFEASKAANAAKSHASAKQNANRFNNYQQRPKKSDDFYNSLLSNNS